MADDTHKRRNDTRLVGRNIFLPTPLGFFRKRVFSTSLSAELYPSGYAISRMSIEDRFVTILIGLGALPDQPGEYIRTLLVNVRKDNEKSPPIAGIVLEGDPFRTKSKNTFGLRTSTMEDHELSEYSLCDKISQIVYRGLEMYASADGCIVNGRKALSFFGDGYIDYAVERAHCAPTLEEAVQRVVIYDNDFDLNYEIALGTAEVPKYSSHQRETISLVTRLYKAGMLGNTSSADQMCIAAGLDLGRIDPGDPGPIEWGQATADFEFVGGTKKKGGTFLFARTRGFHDPNLWLPNGWATDPLSYFRPGLPGFDIEVSNYLNANKFRSHGVVITAPIRLRFLSLAEIQALAWNIFIARAVKYYDDLEYRKLHMS